MFWHKKKQEERCVLPTKDEANTMSHEQFKLILDGCIQAMAKDIQSQIKKGFFAVEWDCMMYCGGAQEMHVQNVRRNEAIRLALCQYLEKNGYLVLWNESKQQLTVRW